MDLISTFIELILHLDRHLAELVVQYGIWVYGILFLIIFCETGLVVTPFLPGDSLLFVTGTLAATGALDVHLLVLLLVAAALFCTAPGSWAKYNFDPKTYDALVSSDSSQTIPGGHSDHAGQLAAV